MRGLSLVAAGGGHSSSRCAGLSLSRPLLLWSTGSRRAGAVVVAHGPSRSVACGIFPDQGSNPCPLHWQADSQPLRHQGSSGKGLLKGNLGFILAGSWEEVITEGRMPGVPDQEDQGIDPSSCSCLLTLWPWTKKEITKITAHLPYARLNASLAHAIWFHFIFT